MTDTLDTADLSIALAQLNPTVGDLAGNAEKVRRAHATARDAGCDVLLLPELFITGYPPDDLVLRPAFAAAARRTVEMLAAELTDGPAVVLGTIWPEDGKLYNAVAVLDGGAITAVRYKVDLPNYGVFDEKRVFAPGPLPGPVVVRGAKLGLPICEDIWTDEVVECLAECGAEVLLVPNASPFQADKIDLRQNIVVARIVESGLPIVYLNQVGGQDELVFDGASFVLNADRTLAVQMPAFQEAITVTLWVRGADGVLACRPSELATTEEGDAAAYAACMLGLRDYVSKNGFPGVVLGLSGGIDSALVAAIAVDALGAERVHCLMLPYRYTSGASLEDAAACASALGVRYDTVPITSPVEGFAAALGDLFAGTNAGITEENIQSRVRGTLLMAVSNKFGRMVVTTGNKSEMSVGYATLYGDMNGGFNPIKDLYKMEVYALSRWRNQNVPAGGLGPAGIVIPERIITKAPTAELRENQTDQDSLPPYEVLDDILRCLVEHEMALPDIVARGHGEEVVAKVARLLKLAEYKRRQAAPGVKISSRSFGRERRYPITNRYAESTRPLEAPVSTPPAAPRMAAPRIDGGDLS